MRISYVSVPEPLTSSMRMRQFEQRFKIPSATFFELYRQGERPVADDDAARDWAIECEVYEEAWRLLTEVSADMFVVQEGGGSSPSFSPSGSPSLVSIS